MISDSDLGVRRGVEFCFYANPAISPDHDAAGSIKLRAAAYSSALANNDAARAEQNALQGEEASRWKEKKKQVRKYVSHDS